MSVKQLVENSVRDNGVVIFSKSWCPHCKKAKNLFATEFPDLKTTIYELDERDDGSEIQSYLAEKTGQTSVPNVFVKQQHIGGNDATQGSFRSGQLKKLLAA